MDKLKILMCSEASFLSSGFGTYTKELLTRLHNTNKYTIAEFASYGFVNDPRDTSIDWIYYANAVKDNDPRHKEYSSKPENQFGRWRFEKVLLDFKPDVVIDIRDYWMSYYQGVSPLRKYFHWILMPTVDSAPQQKDWIDTFLGADAIFSYSDWGGNVLLEQSSNKINYINTASPGVDLQVFNIKDKYYTRDKYGIDKTSIVIGSVMRNQKRKLIPELFYSFRKLLDKLDTHNNNIYLYLHTSYPDMGWDIPDLLMENKISNRVLFSYLCKNCGSLFVSCFSGPQKICKNCLQNSCSFPSVTNGVTQDQLSEIYNMFDLYIQYSICEGFGMPQVEAGACGIPIATVNYSAMVDVVNKLGAFPIPIKTKFKELETQAYRVYPDNDSLINYIIDYINLPEPIRNKKRLEVRQLTEKHYDWDDTAKIWEKYLDKLSDSYRAKWDENLGFIDTNRSIKTDSTVEKILFYCSEYYKDLTKSGSYKMLNIMKDADYGFTQIGTNSFNSASSKNIDDFFKVYADNNNVSEQFILSKQNIEEDFIQYSKMKALSK